MMASPLLWLQGKQLPLVVFRIKPFADPSLLPTQQTPAATSAATVAVAADGRPLVGRRKEMRLILGRVAGMLRDKQGSVGAVILEGDKGK